MKKGMKVKMQSRGMIKTLRGQYDAVAWNGKNESGWRPVADKCLVKPDKAAAMVGSIHMTDENQEKTQLAAESGVLIELGEDAFIWNADRSRKLEGARPKPGDHVGFQRYSGVQVHGDDGQLYFFMSDFCIGAVAIRSETVVGG